MFFLEGSSASGISDYSPTETAVPHLSAAAHCSALLRLLSHRSESNTDARPAPASCRSLNASPPPKSTSESTRTQQQPGGPLLILPDGLPLTTMIHPSCMPGAQSPLADLCLNSLLDLRQTSKSGRCRVGPVHPQPVCRFDGAPFAQIYAPLRPL